MSLLTVIATSNPTVITVSNPTFFRAAQASDTFFPTDFRTDEQPQPPLFSVSQYLILAFTVRLAFT